MARGDYHGSWCQKMKDADRRKEIEKIKNEAKEYIKGCT